MTPALIDQGGDLCGEKGKSVEGDPAQVSGLFLWEPKGGLVVCYPRLPPVPLSVWRYAKNG